MSKFATTTLALVASVVAAVLILVVPNDFAYASGLVVAYVAGLAWLWLFLTLTTAQAPREDQSERPSESWIGRMVPRARVRPVNPVSPTTPAPAAAKRQRGSKLYLPDDVTKNDRPR